MDTSDEMYKLGVRDAEQDDLNLFYYQHYYHYRQGYDQTRRGSTRASFTKVLPTKWKTPSMIAVAVVVLIGVGSLIFFGAHSLFGSQDSDPTQVATSETTQPATAASPNGDTGPSPAANTNSDGTLQVGAVAYVVNVGQSPLRARRKPGIDQPVEARFPAGTQVEILDGPIEADGYVWWRVEGEEGVGWSAERGADGLVLLELPTANPAPAADATATPIVVAEQPSNTQDAPNAETNLHVGTMAQVVNIGLASLRARSEPGINQTIELHFVEGEQVEVLEGPVEADGFLWWLVQGEEGAGWIVERGPDDLILLEALTATPMPTEEAPSQPTPAPEPVMGIGATARVVNIGDSVLSIRSGAGTDYRVIGSLVEGDEVDILDGPIDAEGYTWWRVESDAGTGWCAGEVGDTAMLEPLTAAVPTNTPTVAPTPESSLQVGDIVVVVNLGNTELSVRSKPGVDQSLTTSLPEGAEAELLEGPVEADGYIWWRVESDDGTGWCAESGPDGGTWLELLPPTPQKTATPEETATSERTTTSASSARTTTSDATDTEDETPEPTETKPATPQPVPTTSAVSALQVGSVVEVVNVGGFELSARSKPGTDEPVMAGFPEGTQVTILDGPVVIGDYVWWRVEGQQGIGWCAEKGPDDAVWLQPRVVFTPVVRTPEGSSERTTPTKEPTRNTSSAQTPTATANSSGTTLETLMETATRSTPEAEEPTPTTTEDNSASLEGLEIGGIARIVNVQDPGLSLRDKPGDDQAIQSSLPVGTEVQILDGPVESDGYTWWRVDSIDGTGWCAEALPNGTILLQPPFISSDVASNADEEEEVALPLEIGGNAKVVNIGQARLSARSKPGFDQPVQVRLPEDANVEVTDGPVDADGYTWWLVDATEGTGWVPDSGPDGEIWLQGTP